jgi:hypothetical protein
MQQGDIPAHDLTNRETQRGAAHIAKFKSENPNWARDREIEAALTQAVKDEQRADLAFDAERFRNEIGRDRTDQKVVEAHRHAREHDFPGMRPVEQLLNDSASKIDIAAIRKRKRSGKRKRSSS